MTKLRALRAMSSAFLLSILISMPAVAAKTDVIVLINGDRVTGEVKSLEFGVLRYSTDSMGTVNIDWEDVISLTSNQSMQVEMDSGTRYFGNLHQSEAPGLINVGRGENVEALSKRSVVRLTPIETSERLIGRFEGSVGFSLDADKGSEVSTSRVEADSGYWSREFFVGLDLTSTITDQSGAETTERNSLALNYQRFKNNRWFTDWVVSSERNDALGLDQRLTIGGGLGRYVIQSNSNQLSLLAGLNVTREELAADDIAGIPENPTEDDLVSTNIEAKFTLDYLHRSLSPDTDWSFSVEIYPLLDDFSSLRGESELKFSREFIDDLYFDISLFYSFVSEVTTEADNTDYGINTALTYKF